LNLLLLHQKLLLFIKSLIVLAGNMPGKRRCQNTIPESRRIAEDRLLYSDNKLYIDGLILQKPLPPGIDGQQKAQYSCRQVDCQAQWIVPLEHTTTTNYRCHYKKWHKHISIDKDKDLPPSSNPSEIAPSWHNRTITSFWSNTTPAIVSYKHGPNDNFDQEVFI
jgi:hypothetical protein